MTISSPDTIDTTLIQDGQAAGSITPADARVWVDSLAGLFTSTQTGSYTALLTDRGTCVEMTVASANTFTIPPNSTAAFDIGAVIKVRQMGAGATTIVAGAGVTLRTPSTLVIRAQYASAFVHKRGTNEWVVDGDLT